jgi:Tfp pilus assembly protein PilP
MKINKILLFIVGIFVIAIVCLNACSSGDKFHSLRAKLAKIKLAREKSSHKYSLVEVRIPTPVTYGYDATQMGNKAAVNKLGAPLQAVPLSQLKFIGTITEDNELLAYIATPDGNTYSVKKGDMIGDQYGRIVNIDSTKIEVTEKELAKGNKVVEKIVVMQLKE